MDRNLCERADEGAVRTTSTRLISGLKPSRRVSARLFLPAVATVAATAAALVVSSAPAGAQARPAAPLKIAAAAQTPRGTAGAKPTLEMVFALDTTGSMGGLIEGAKQRIWGIVNDVMSSPTRPNVRIGLVAYRDRGDDYVTKVLPLTSDLDKVYSTLMDYQANGGGDEPEDVRQALSDAVGKAGWSERSPRIAQVVFLVGDAPPHTDYPNEADVSITADRARNRGIVVNAIQCGSIQATQPVWQQIARRGEGEYFAIAQDGGVQAVATPYDGELSKLGGAMGRTYFAYGGGGGARGASVRAGEMRRQATVEAKVAAAAPMPAQADRAINKAINSSAYASNDLVQAVENGQVKLDKVKTDDLPDDLKKMTPAQRKATIDQRIAERKTTRAKILDLSKKRDAYLVAERKKQVAKGNKKAGAFDIAVGAALRKQIARKGIRL